MSDQWVLVCKVGEIDDQDLIRFDHGDQTYAVYFIAGKYYATDGLCTHEEQHLADGLVIDDIIECPLHQGRFHIPSGAAQGAPVCIDLNTYPTRLEGDQVYIQISGHIEKHQRDGGLGEGT